MTPFSTPLPSPRPGSLAERFLAVRRATRALAAPLSPEDCAIQSMPDASPVKWHLAHTTWFFETIVLARGLGRQPFDSRFAYLFNSYYEALGARIPTIFGFREFVDAGGLMSYGPNFADLFRHAADLVDKILRGAKPADLPLQQPTKFDLAINLITAKSLGLEVPPTLLARADEVIE